MFADFSIRGPHDTSLQFAAGCIVTKWPQNLV